MPARSYLQWIGTSNFATIDDFVSHVEANGVSKKLPNRHVALEVVKSGTVIFLTHDEGRFQECLACAEMQTCTSCGGSGGGDDSRLVCQRCKGLGSLERGTGGDAIVDGQRWPYTRYVRLRRNRGHEFWKTEHEIGEVDYCMVCGGRGRVPLGAIFALYSPESVQYVSRIGDAAARLEAYMGAGIEVFEYAAVRARGWTEGSFYASVEPATPGTAPTLEVVRNIVEAISRPVTAYGNFVRLAEPMAYRGKHFRGLKRWELLPTGDNKPTAALMEGVA